MGAEETKIQIAVNNVTYWQGRLNHYLDKNKSKYRHAGVLQSQLDRAKDYLASFIDSKNDEEA